MKEYHTRVNFRLIALCNITYKVAAKILANRTCPLLDDIISPHQAVYISGRQILDHFVVTQGVDPFYG